MTWPTASAVVARKRVLWKAHTHTFYPLLLEPLQSQTREPASQSFSQSVSQPVWPQTFGYHHHCWKGSRKKALIQASSLEPTVLKWGIFIAKWTTDQATNQLLLKVRASIREFALTGWLAGCVCYNYSPFQLERKRRRRRRLQKQTNKQASAAQLQPVSSELECLFSAAAADVKDGHWVENEEEEEDAADQRE